MNFACKTARSFVSLDDVRGTASRSDLRLVRATIASIGLLVLGFMIWATLASINETSVTFGEVVPAGTVQSVQHLEGGIITEILVQEGELVTAGQPLMRLDPSITESDQGQLVSRRASLGMQVERLRAFIEGREPNFTAFQQLPGMVADQREILAAQFKTRDNQREVLEQQLAKTKGQLASARRQQSSQLDILTAISQKRQIREELFKNGNGSKLQLIEANREFAAMDAEVQQLNGVIGGYEKTITELAARKAELDGRLRQEALDRLGALSAELAEVEKRLGGLGSRVERLVVVAPKAGLVQELPIKTLGGVVPPGGTVARIVPVEETPIVETRISTQDIGFVSAGQPVRIKVQAFDFTRYGTIDGTLISISPTTFFDERKTPYFLGRVRLLKSAVRSRTGVHMIVPGMTVEADIETGRKTVMQYLLNPVYKTLAGGLQER